MLLGREAELAEIRRLLDDARDGRSGVLALVGEAGIGKSSLLEEAAALADDMLLLRARGVASEAQIPFASLLELLRPALGLLDRIPGPQAEALESALALRPAHAADRFAVGAATLSLLAVYAETQPLAVLVDDANWLDASSADAVLFAARRLVADPIAVLLTVRDGVSSLLDGADLPVLELAGLDLGATQRLLPDATPELAERLHRETGGNPLALLELAREPRETPPLDAPVPVLTSVSEVFLHRAEALPEATRDTLVLAAATDRAEPALFVRAGGDVEALEPADAAGLVTVGGGRIEFRHPLVRSAIYAAASPQTRRRVHLALAAALPDADADRRAWHLALAAVGPDDVACSALAQAGARARERSAYDVAAQAYERAARLAGDDARRGGLLGEAADAAWLGGEADRALALLDEAAPLVDSLEQAHLRGLIALRRGPVGAGVENLLAAAERAEASLAPVLLAEAVYGAFLSADARTMQECAERARSAALGASTPAESFFSHMTLGIAGVLAGDSSAGAAAIRSAASEFEAVAELRDDPRLLVWAAVGPLWLREAEAGHELTDWAVATARAAAAVGVLPYLLMHVATDQAATDRWVEALAGFDEAIALARESGQLVVLSFALARLAWLEARLGREEAAREHAEEALLFARELGVALCEMWVHAALGELELVLGRPDQALEELSELEALLARHELVDADLAPAPELVEIHLRLGDEGRALRSAAEYEAAAVTKGQPWARARAARARGLVAADGEFALCFDEALELHAETPDVFEVARTRLVYGARLRRSGQRTAAREQLRAAHETFEDLGAAPWAEQARAELAATGETARRRDPSTRDELTPQELQVSLLLAEGRTTKEAAAALFLSPKTIEYHLRNAYRKLAIHSREELREALRVERALARD
ncbi:MAG TPA: AAA family ATPase [Gaiellaceae bacterium]|nr:AAA family ATPase [Gaiellaceae bacterium]